MGINVQPHAVLVLRDLGLLPSLQSTGVETRELNYYDQYGNPIISEPRGLFAGYKVPQFSIHRGRLQMLLFEAVRERLGDACVHLNHSLQSFQLPEDAERGRVTLRFRQRRSEEAAQTPEAEADLVVAADGINSTFRRQLYPEEGPPHFSGRILWRGCVERPPYLTGASMVWSGHANQKFIAYPISPVSMEKTGKETTLVNWIAELRVRDENDPDTTPPEKTDWTLSVPKEKFAGAFAKWDFGFLNVPDLIDSTEQVFEYPMCDRTPVNRWSFGRLTLLGDAAHPMYPIGKCKRFVRLTRTVAHYFQAAMEHRRRSLMPPRWFDASCDTATSRESQKLCKTTRKNGFRQPLASSWQTEEMDPTMCCRLLTSEPPTASSTFTTSYPKRSSRQLALGIKPSLALKWRR